MHVYISVIVHRCLAHREYLLCIHKYIHKEICICIIVTFAFINSIQILYPIYVYCIHYYVHAHSLERCLGVMSILLLDSRGELILYKTQTTAVYALKAVSDVYICMYVYLAKYICPSKYIWIYMCTIHAQRK